MRRVLLISAALAVIALIYGLRMYFKPHEDVSRQRADFEYAVAEITSLFENNAAEVDAGLSGRIVQLTGVPASVKALPGQFLLTFDEGGDYVVQAYVPADGADSTALRAEAPVTLKCRYAGYIVNDEDFLIPADIKIEACVEVR